MVKVPGGIAYGIFCYSTQIFSHVRFYRNSNEQGKVERILQMRGLAPAISISMAFGDRSYTADPKFW